MYLCLDSGQVELVKDLQLFTQIAWATYQTASLSLRGFMATAVYPAAIAAAVICVIALAAWDALSIALVVEERELQSIPKNTNELLKGIYNGQQAWLPSSLNILNINMHDQNKEVRHDIVTYQYAVMNSMNEYNYCLTKLILTALGALKEDPTTQCEPTKPQNNYRRTLLEEEEEGDTVNNGDVFSGIIDPSVNLYDEIMKNQMHILSFEAKIDKMMLSLQKALDLSRSKSKTAKKLKSEKIFERRLNVDEEDNDDADNELGSEVVEVIKREVAVLKDEVVTMNEEVKMAMKEEVTVLKDLISQLIEQNKATIDQNKELIEQNKELM